MKLLDVFIKWLMENYEVSELVSRAESSLAHCGDNPLLEVALSRFVALAAGNSPEQGHEEA